MAKRKPKASVNKASANKAASTPSAPVVAKKPLQDNIDALDDVRLTMTIELGRTRDTIGKVSEYGDQSLIELDKMVGDPVDVLLNGELFARGEVVTVSENFGVRITELVTRPGG